MIFVIALTTAGGAVLVSSFLRERGRDALFERLCLGYGAGLGAASYFIFLLGAFKVPYTLASVLPPFLILIIICAAVSFLARQKAGEAWASGGGGTGAEGVLIKTLMAVLIVWIGFKVSFVLIEGLNRPILAQDSWFNRSAKVFFYNRGLMLDTADEHFFGRGYRIILGYPLLTFMEQLWVSFMIGTFHESLAKAWAPFYFLSIVGLVFVTVKREGGVLPALIAAAFLSAAPLLTFHAVESYSDIALSYNLLAGSVLLWRYMEKGDNGAAALSGLFMGMAVFTKSEGLIYIGAAGLSLLAHTVLEKNGRWRPLFYFIASAAVYILPWVVFKSYYGLGYGHGYGTGVGAADEMGAIPWAETPHFEIWGVLFKEMFLSVDSGHIFAFLAFITFIGFRDFSRSNIKYICLVLAVIVAGYLFVYTMTYDYKYVMNRMATNRNFVTIVPLAALIGGLIAARVAKGLVKTRGKGGGDRR